jgi:hypothetical protein
MDLGSGFTDFEPIGQAYGLPESVWEVGGDAAIGVRNDLP